MDDDVHAVVSRVMNYTQQGYKVAGNWILYWHIKQFVMSESVS